MKNVGTSNVQGAYISYSIVANAFQMSCLQHKHNETDQTSITVVVKKKKTKPISDKKKPLVINSHELLNLNKTCG